MLGNIGPVQLLIVLAIIVLLFGTKKLRNMGPDLGSAIKGFKDSMKNGEEEEKDSQSSERVIENGEESDSGASDEARREKNSSS